MVFMVLLVVMDFQDIKFMDFEILHFATIFQWFRVELELKIMLLIFPILFTFLNIKILMDDFLIECLI